MTSPAQISSTAGALTDTVAPAIAPPSPAALAVNVANVKTHIPVVLNLQASNFTKWDMLLGVLLGRYELTDHISVDTPAAARDAEWMRQDFTVRSWLYGSISDDILDTIMGPNQTAYVAYMLIRNLFLDNQLTRAVYLEAGFRALAQGDRTIAAYCHRLKTLSDALRNVGQPVTDQTLVPTCLRGLNPRFSDITTLVTMQVPFPTFLQTRSLLLLHENQLPASLPGMSSAS
ncbi:uncharacterized protein [Lolium perenne]|uniref:uncharacterized protein n=1 Tax=Lolium perenne TaxID=4522 RepID=UPI0021F66CD3|nr:uncharacterized protein LOC127335166 [Lolium perenne]